MISSGPRVKRQESLNNHNSLVQVCTCSVDSGSHYDQEWPEHGQAAIQKDHKLVSLNAGQTYCRRPQREHSTWELHYATSWR